MPALLDTQFSDLDPVLRGKVRDLYSAGDDLLIVATDRISAFDHVLRSGIPGKGEVLTQLSLFWFDFLATLVPNHLISADVDDYPAPFARYADALRGRSMLVRRARMFPVECVARGYLSGSGWKDYQATGRLCGIALPAGLRESDRLPEPLFTPASKSAGGEHDENISFDAVVGMIGGAAAETLRTVTLAIYARASAHAEACGLILADTKFEFGVIDSQIDQQTDSQTGPHDRPVGASETNGIAEGTIVLADEALTPDSSRYWPQAGYAPGGPQPSFDKQFVRDYLETIGWDKKAPAPALPDAVIAATREKYIDAFRLLTGRHFLFSGS